jgi:NhaP-type Na+/H+ or K+/H+ antiporter
MIPLLVFLILLFAYSLVSRRLESTMLTAPMLFTIAGMLLFPLLPAIREAGMDQMVLLRIAEIGLVLLLFTDASRTDLGRLYSMQALPVRLLSIGMLLTIVVGAVAAKLVFPSLSLGEAGILSSILAPTDAGLGQVIVCSPRVPLRVRQALNIEAGLNDGLSVPFLLFFITLATAKQEGSFLSLPRFMGEQLGYGIVVGLAIGLIGGWVLGLAERKQWMAEPFTRIGVVALPLVGMGVAEVVDASMFIVAFVAGLSVQAGFKDAGKHSIEFAEEWGQLFNLAVFFLFGILVVKDSGRFSVLYFEYALLSLTVVRILPVAAALAGTGFSRSSVLFIGWFGPRGLTSIVLGLVYFEQQARLGGESIIIMSVIVTVATSIFLHGLSAAPAISWYERKVAALGPDAPEMAA